MVGSTIEPNVVAGQDRRNKVASRWKTPEKAVVSTARSGGESAAVGMGVDADAGLSSMVMMFLTLQSLAR